MSISYDGIEGLWSRKLLEYPRGKDDTTQVSWLQGPFHYCDLRQPSGRPVSQAKCLRELERSTLLWMSTQEGFAGKLVLRGMTARWRRVMDLQPATGWEDRASLSVEGNVMVEKGLDLPYTEHWERVPGPLSPSGALQLEDVGTRAPGIVVRVGKSFMYARGRPAAASLPSGDCLPGCCLPAAWCWCCLLVRPSTVADKFLPDLHALVKGARTDKDAQDLFDCEISFGTVDASGWHIERSSLPFREGTALGLRVEYQPQGGGASVADLDPDGQAYTRTWKILESEGDNHSWAP